MRAEVKRKRPIRPSDSLYFGVRKPGESRVQAIEIPQDVLADREKRLCFASWRTLGDYLQGCPQFGYSALDVAKPKRRPGVLRPTVCDPLEVWRVREWVKRFKRNVAA